MTAEGGRDRKRVTNRTPSVTEYCNWINVTNEGATEAQTLTNLRFFEWLHDAYGFQLDSYLLDAGVIDGSNFYGSTSSERFKRQFPDGFGPIVDAAARFGCRLGIWLGPDGFGDTPEEEAERTEMVLSLFRDHGFRKLKLDQVCGMLRPEKQDAFCNLIEQCRECCPELIVDCCAIDLGKGRNVATTHIGFDTVEEAYIDVHMRNLVPAPHNRAQSLHQPAEYPALNRQAHCST